MLINGANVYIAVGHVDFRKSIDGLAVIVQECFKLDPFSKAIYVFCNKRKDKVKLLVWENDGFWLHYKRLEKGKFRWPEGKLEAMSIEPRALRWLLDGLSLNQNQALKPVKERVII